MKHKICRNFDRGAKQYEQVAYVQREAAEIVVNLLQENYRNFNPLTILDLGAGTAYVTENLLSIYPNSHYLLNDISANMINVARHKFQHHSNIDYYICDMEEYEFDHHDLIVSNFALQWVNNLEEMIDRASRNATIFAFSTLLAGSLQEWFDLCAEFGIVSERSLYPTLGYLQNYCLSLQTTNHLFICHDFAIHFDSVLSFVKYLKLLGANSSDIVIDASALKKIIKYHSASFSTNYKVFFAILENK